MNTENAYIPVAPTRGRGGIPLSIPKSPIGQFHDIIAFSFLGIHLCR